MMKLLNAEIYKNMVVNFMERVVGVFGSGGSGGNGSNM